MNLRQSLLVITCSLVVSCGSSKKKTAEEPAAEPAPVITGIEVATYVAPDNHPLPSLLSQGLNSPQDMVIVDNNIYLADTNAQQIWVIESTTTQVGVNSLAVSGGSIGEPFGITKDNAGNIYVSDQAGYRVIRIDQAGAVTLVAGGAKGYNLDDADDPGDSVAGTAAMFELPTALVFDETQNALYLADSGNNVIFRIDLNDDPTFTTRRLSGAQYNNSGVGFSDTLSAGTGATEPRGRYRGPQAMILIDNPAGGKDLIISDNGNKAIRKFALSADPDGDSQIPSVNNPGNMDPFHSPLTVLAGAVPGSPHTYDESSPVYGDDLFFSPGGLALDHEGNILVADTEKNRIRKITLDAQGNAVAVSTFAGSDSGEFGSNDTVAINAQHDPLSATFYKPKGIVAFDSDLNDPSNPFIFFVSDSQNSLIRRISTLN